MGKSQNRKRRRTPFEKTLFIDLFLDSKARPVLIYAALFIAVCSALFHWLEGWSWLDSIYFVVITFTTIGYGDFVPTLPITKIITIFVGLNGVAILLLLFDEIRRVRSWHKVEQPTEDRCVKLS
jgi:hypothetical protein